MSRITVPVLLEWDYDKVVGELSVDASALPATPDFTFAIGYRHADELFRPAPWRPWRLVCACIVSDASYAAYLAQQSSAEGDAKPAAPERWYVVDKDGIAALRDSHADAVAEAEAAQRDRPERGPYIVTRLATPEQPEHPDDAAVDRFAAAMKAKLAQKRAEGRGGWDDPEQCRVEFLSDLLHGHVRKGDPVDVGNLAMMLHQRGSGVLPEQPGSSVQGERAAAERVLGQRARGVIHEWHSKATELGYDGVADLLACVERGEPPIHIAELLARTTPPPAPAADHIADAGKLVAPAAEQGERPVVRVGAIGHVDHGKTTLTAALTAVGRMVQRTDRNARQQRVHDWCVAAFGDDHARSLEQRAIRMAEEAIEAAQACGCDRDMLHSLVNYIYARPVGELRQELGGVGVTLLALAQAAGLSADDAEADEVARVLAKPLEHFAARNAAKNAAGFNVTPQEPT